MFLKELLASDAFGTAQKRQGATDDVRTHKVPDLNIIIGEICFGQAFLRPIDPVRVGQRHGAAGGGGSTVVTGVSRMISDADLSSRSQLPQTPAAPSISISTRRVTDPTDKAAFVHAPRDSLPMLEGEGKEVRLILGTAYGETAPVPLGFEVFYADAKLAPGAAIPLPQDHEDRGAFVLQGAVTAAGETYEAGRMLVFRPGDAISLRAGAEGARLFLLGGATADGPRHIWWNFVASSKERIEAAKEAWRAGDWMHGRFRLPPGDAEEFIPAPEK